MSDLITRTWLGLASWAEREDGQALTEYALVIVLVAAVFGLVVAFEPTIANKIGNALTSAIN